MNQRALDDLIAFLDDSPSPWHAVQSVRARLDRYAALDETAAWSSVPERGLVVRGGALIAWHIPAGLAPSAPLRIVGAHTDSPCLRVKPHPDTGVGGWRQLGVETYGGILNNTWLDRDLAVAGVVLGADGVPTLFDSEAPVARVPQLAVHLDRGVNTDGLKLDTQRHLLPVWGVAPNGPDRLRRLAGLDGRPRCATHLVGTLSVRRARCRRDRRRPFDACVGSARQLAVVLGATVALDAATPDGAGAVIVLNDHEEVGSASTSGAAGPFLDTVLQRLIAGRGGTADDLARSFAGSACISADNAHALHPNYVDRHEPSHQPTFNAGPVIKVNANQRYATSAATAERFQRACDSAGGALAGVRVAQQHALRIDHRPAHRDAARYRHRRRRRRPAVDALGTRAVRGRRPAGTARCADRVFSNSPNGPARVSRRATALRRTAAARSVESRSVMSAIARRETATALADLGMDGLTDHHLHLAGIDPLGPPVASRGLTPRCPPARSGTPGASRDERSPVEEWLDHGAILALSLGEQHERLALFEHSDAPPKRFAGSALPRATGKTAERREHPADPRVLPHLLFAHEADPPPRDTGHDRRVDVAAVYRRNDVGALGRQVRLPSDPDSGDHGNDEVHQTPNQRIERQRSSPSGRRRWVDPDAAACALTAPPVPSARCAPARPRRVRRPPPRSGDHWYRTVRASAPARSGLSAREESLRSRSMIDALDLVDRPTDLGHAPARHAPVATP